MYMQVCVVGGMSENMAGEMHVFEERGGRRGGWEVRVCACVLRGKV